MPSNVRAKKWALVDSQESLAVGNSGVQTKLCSIVHRFIWGWELFHLNTVSPNTVSQYLAEWISGLQAHELIFLRKYLPLLCLSLRMPNPLAHPNLTHYLKSTKMSDQLSCTYDRHHSRCVSIYILCSHNLTTSFIPQFFSDGNRGRLYCKASPVI